jgi:hypothetical protein
VRINNKEDPVPILPGRFLGYVHSSGEIHIEDSGAWDACPGTETLAIGKCVEDGTDGDVGFQARTTRLPCAPQVTSRASSKGMRSALRLCYFA